MALQTNYTGPDGVNHPACYWRVVSKQDDFISKEVRVTVARYHDKASRDAIPEKRAEMFSFSLPLDPGVFDSGRSRALVYGALKGLPFYTGATDVLEVV